MVMIMGQKRDVRTTTYWKTTNDEMINGRLYVSLLNEPVSLSKKIEEKKYFRYLFHLTTMTISAKTIMMMMMMTTMVIDWVLVNLSTSFKCIDEYVKH